MMRFMALWAAGRSSGDQPLTQAARVALEASQTPRFIKMIVDQDGKPIEKPEALPMPVVKE